MANGGVMINFIVCDDNKEILQLINKIINKIMFKTKIGYEVFQYIDYNQIKNYNKNNVIYILDIEVGNISGIDIARRIRLKDYKSPIIFLTSHGELANTIIEDDIMFLSFINKFNNMEKRLEQAIKTAVNILNNNQVVEIIDKDTTYYIDQNDVYYIKSEKLSKKSIIKTTNELKVNKTLKELEQLFPNLIRSHKSCLVNKSKITQISKEKNCIRFSNGEVIYLLSNNYKKDLLIG